MPIDLIACFSVYQTKWAIGREDQLLVHLPIDLTRFAHITTSTPRTVVVMGRRTWDSLPRRPLLNRINFVLTRTPHRGNRPVGAYADLTSTEPYWLTFEDLCGWYTQNANAPVMIIGGGEVYNMALRTWKMNRMYLTLVYDYNGPSPTVFMNKPSVEYRITETSPVELDRETGLFYQFLTYEPTTQPSSEAQYLELCQRVLREGRLRPDRTGVGTLGIFGCQLRLDIASSVPLLTTKRVAWKHCIEELLWFLRGDTDARRLQEKGVHIWDGNTSRAYLDAQGLTHYEEGILGPGYGWCWRNFGAPYDPTCPAPASGGVDQIQYILDELRSNPHSRRLLVTAWNPVQVKQVALPPCHFAFQFYVEEGKFLNCHFMMRSTDIGCGLPFNLFSYTVLTYLIALKSNLTPKTLVYSCTDAHIYQTHVDAIRIQLQRTPTVAPQLVLHPDLRTKSFEEMRVADFDVVGYFPEPSIQMTMAV